MFGLRDVIRTLQLDLCCRLYLQSKNILSAALNNGVLLSNYLLEICTVHGEWGGGGMWGMGGGFDKHFKIPEELI